ncbi:hypothetical protein BGZ72_009549 [Mortierella alpina]|nr:hypothetical protein BGZ72_009549 [Mortierella alpina]
MVDKIYNIVCKDPEIEHPPECWEAQKIMYGNMVEYGTVLRNVIIDVKGPMKPETSTSAGMATFTKRRPLAFYM